MTKHMTPAQLAEVPPPTHPAIVDRLVEQLHDVTLLLDTADAETFASEDELWHALAALRVSADKLAAAAEPRRRPAPSTYPRF